MNLALKLLCLIAASGVWTFIYMWLNALGSQSARAKTFAPPIDRYPILFVPNSAILYLLGGIVLPILPFYWYWTWKGITRVLAAYAIASMITFIVYFAWPVKMARPQYDGSSVGDALMRAITSLDDPANCFPSSHVIFAILGACFVSEATSSTALSVAVWVFAALLCVTTITVGQHFFIDIPGGIAVALVGYGLSRSLTSMLERLGNTFVQ